MARTRGLAYAQIAPDLTVVEASPNLKALVTANAEEVVGQRLTDLFWEFVGAEEALLAILNGESASYRLEWVNFVLPDGTTTYLTFEVGALDEAEPGAGLIFVIEDATAHGRLEQVVMQDRNELRLIQGRLTAANAELQRLLQFKSLVLSLASSEFRTPLTTIRLYAGLLMKESSTAGPEDRQRFIATIYGQANRLASLVNDLLDLDLIEAGHLNLNRVPCDLSSMIRQVAEVMNAVVIPRRLTWTFDLPEQPLIVQGDAEHLWRIVYNLSSNAVKYAPENTPIQVIGRFEADAAALHIVSAGPSMTETQLAQLFQPYYHTEGARQNPLSGADLGLFVVKYLVEAHGGRLAVTSQPDRGTIFSVRLPLQ
ncbi:MAG: HAMP domain-containing histidine kinase [Chloroflexi bacterium]|nr:HAMP domain-containing histidine kinase [Chloroflexota bacterium]